MVAELNKQCSVRGFWRLCLKEIRLTGLLGVEGAMTLLDRDFSIYASTS